MLLHWFPKVILLLVGLVVTFFGYRLFKFTLVVAGFALGVYLGIFLSGKLNITGWIIPVLTILLGIIGAVLTVLLFKISVFLLGAITGGLLSTIFAPPQGWNFLLFLLIGGVLGGILALLIQRPFISLLTAFLGAWWVVVGVFSLFGITQLDVGSGWRMPLVIISWLGLGGTGFLTQILKTSKKRA